MRNVRFQVARNDTGNFIVQEYCLPYQPQKTIVWWLTRIQEELDPSLAFPIACRAGLCGGCGLMINNRSVLACETMLDTFLTEGNDMVSLMPLRGFPVIKDLLVDWIPAKERMQQLAPWDHSGRVIDIRTDLALKPDACNSLMKLGSCITCGLCVSECPVRENGAFIEPYLFVKCHKILVDPRVDEVNKQAVISSLEPYLNWCIGCGKCTEVCPKGLSPKATIHCIRQLHH